MPTGYTYPVVEGKITEFPAFAMSCARAFGALITMRDDAMDAPIPETIEPQTKYYDERIATDLKRMGDIQAMTNTEAEAAAITEHEEGLASRKKYLAGKDPRTQRVSNKEMSMFILMKLGSLLQIP